MKDAEPRRELPQPLTVEEVDTFSHQYGITSHGGPLPEHHDDVTGVGLRNPVAWVVR